MTEAIIRSALYTALTHPRERSQGELMDEPRHHDTAPTLSPTDWRTDDRASGAGPQFAAIGPLPVIACDECHKSHARCERSNSQACNRCLKLGQSCRTDRPIISKSFSFLGRVAVNVLRLGCQIAYAVIVKPVKRPSEASRSFTPDKRARLDGSASRAPRPASLKKPAAPYSNVSRTCSLRTAPD